MNSSIKILINKDNLKDNIDCLRAKTQDYKKVIISLKNNCYNHGLILVNFFAKLGYDIYKVDNLDEALEVKKYNRDVKIIIDEKINLEYIYDCLNNDFIIRIYSLDDLKKIVGLKFKEDLQVEILLSTSLGCPGLKSINEFNETIKLIKETQNIHLFSITTDLLETPIDYPDYDKQVKSFRGLLKDQNLNDILIYLGEKSLFYKKLSIVNTVYFDSLLYGLKPEIDKGFLDNLKFKQNLRKNNLEDKLSDFKVDLKTAYAIETHLIDLFNLNETSEFYNYKFSEKTVLGVLPIGKKEGINIDFKYVIIGNENYPILKVTYNYTYILMTNLVDINEKVYLLKDNLNKVCGYDPRNLLMKINDKLPYYYLEK